MKKAKNKKELSDSLIGWKQHKKVFTVYFEKNVAKEFIKLLNKGE